jgi:Virulence protein
MTDNEITNNQENQPPQGQLILFQDGATRIQVRIDGQTVWLAQAAMAELFQTTPQNITIHLKNIYEEGELSEEATCKEYLQVRIEGARQVRRNAKFYSLEAILAVGYRVRSPRGTMFRQWATNRLQELLVKGFTMDDERLKEGQTLGNGYFEELLERIRDIRASERMFYQKITDIYATSIDYDSKTKITQEFFATVQNKLHWAIHGHTAAELIHEQADSQKTNMGLATWKNAPKGPIRKSDVSIAKNYLNEAHVKELNRIVSAYLDLAENRAQRGIVTCMAEWVEFLNRFLELSDYPILMDSGKVSALEAKLKAEGEYEVFRKRQDKEHISDFDREIKRLQGKKKENGGDDG